MKIHVQIHGNMLKPRGVAEETIHIDSEATVERLLVEMGYLKEHIKYIIAVRNGEMIRHRELLSDGDTVQLSIPIGGG
ncbi:MAG: MoaD/ThiS family protein [bacterium]